MARAYSTEPPGADSIGVESEAQREGASATGDGLGRESGSALATWPELEALIGPRGALGARLEGYERRSGQELMMRSVATTLERGGTLVVEAGTGIGKSLAYLVPAALSGQRVILSTGTRTLQDQLWMRQVPFVRDELGIAVEATVLKGRTNYLCLLLLERARDNPAIALDAFADLEKIRAWREKTTTGDRAELTGPHEVPDGSTAWRAVAADAEQCLGRSCAHFNDCFLMAARRRAESADLVIVNHHLFFADLQLREDASFALLPEAHAVVFDEAHHLEDVAAMAFGRQVSDARLRRLAIDMRRGFREADRELGPLEPTLAELERDRERLFAHLSHVQSRTRFVATRMPDAFQEAWFKLDNTLIGLGLLASAQARADDGLLRLAGRVDELRADLASLIGPEEKAASGDEEVRWIERGPRTTFVRSAPVHVGKRLGQALFPRFRALVFTSATLSTDRSFAHFKDRLGLASDSPELHLPSPFDYAAQAILYVARDLPEPRSPAFASRANAVIERLVRLTEGRALLLFTSRERMLEAHAALQDRIAHPILVQGQGSKEALLGRFRELPGAVLFATATFWEGVDIVGDALSLVVIDKLPFQPPGDPIVDARVAKLAAEGRNAFVGYQVPHAILALKQGVGRLIRHRGDRGIIALLDPRVATARYGAMFLASMPPARRTSDLTELEAWWRELERATDKNRPA